jgi:hypothetical protein
MTTERDRGGNDRRTGVRYGANSTAWANDVHRKRTPGFAERSAHTVKRPTPVTTQQLGALVATTTGGLAAKRAFQASGRSLTPARRRWKIMGGSPHLQERSQWNVGPALSARLCVSARRRVAISRFHHWCWEGGSRGRP